MRQNATLATCIYMETPACRSRARGRPAQARVDVMMNAWRLHCGTFVSSGLRGRRSHMIRLTISTMMAMPARVVHSGLPAYSTAVSVSQVATFVEAWTIAGDDALGRRRRSASRCLCVDRRKEQHCCAQHSQPGYPCLSVASLPSHLSVCPYALLPFVLFTGSVAAGSGLEGGDERSFCLPTWKYINT